MSASAPKSTSVPYVRWLIFLFSLLFLIAGSVRVAPRARLWMQRDDLRREVGRVAASDVVVHGGRDFETARVIIEYEVEGETYKLRTSGNDGLALSASSPSAFVARYPVGSQTSVYYAPKQPALAALTREVSPTTDLLTLLFFMLVSAVAGTSLIVHRRRRRGRENRVQSAPQVPRA